MAKKKTTKKKQPVIPAATLVEQKPRGKHKREVKFAPATHWWVMWYYDCGDDDWHCDHFYELARAREAAEEVREERGQGPTLIFRIDLPEVELYDDDC